MMDRATVFGPQSGPHEIEYQGKTYHVNWLTQKSYAEIEKQVRAVFRKEYVEMSKGFDDPKEKASFLDRAIASLTSPSFLQKPEVEEFLASPAMMYIYIRTLVPELREATQQEIQMFFLEAGDEFKTIIDGMQAVWKQAELELMTLESEGNKDPKAIRAVLKKHGIS
jgi:hypothetical protein